MEKSSHSVCAELQWTLSNSMPKCLYKFKIPLVVYEHSSCSISSPTGLKSFYWRKVDLSCLLISALQKSDSYTYIFFSIVGYHRILNIVPCAVQWGGSLIAQTVKNLPAMQETWVRSLGWEDTLEKEMATDSSILAWRIPWTEEPGGLQFLRSIH